MQDMRPGALSLLCHPLGWSCVTLPWQHTLGGSLHSPFRIIRPRGALQKLPMHQPVGRWGKCSNRRRNTMLLDQWWAWMVPPQQEMQQKRKQRGQAAFLAGVCPLLDGEHDGDGRNHPTAMVTTSVKPWKQRGRHMCAGKAGRATGFSERECTWIYESVLSSVANHPQEPA